MANNAPLRDIPPWEEVDDNVEEEVPLVPQGQRRGRQANDNNILDPPPLPPRAVPRVLPNQSYASAIVPPRIWADLKLGDGAQSVKEETTAANTDSSSSSSFQNFQSFCNPDFQSFHGFNNQPSTMVKSRGGGDKQKGRAESSRGRGRGMIKLTPTVCKAIGETRKLIKAANRAASHSEGSEYLPSREASESDSVPEYVPDFPERLRLRDSPTPPGSPTARASVQVPSESSEGSAESSDSAASTSPTTSSPGEDPIDEEEGGEPQPGGVERTRNPEVWKRRFVSELAYHKFREWWPLRSLIIERQFIQRDLLPHNPNVKRQFRERPG
ncbi:PREDICTED: serine/arginine repetitive matrix protein 2-like [Nicotiana attenuata]|uniref:serine/arginine repetitive matrix protein 2-like n=1 Tax=Nicotiana attenuata TaxID=49451 RepID=UPI00090535FB|nr:PREDICTED: serine/arginine repetitive matrix protein 2-like [Nicotiana attenuata]